MVSNCAKLDCRTKQHTEFGVSASNGSRDIAGTKVVEKKNERRQSHKHPLRGSLIMTMMVMMTIIVLIMMIIILTRKASRL